MTPELRAEWDHAGLASGHAWATCSVCGAVAMIPRDATKRSCSMEPGCRGKMVLPVGRPTPLAAFRAGDVSVQDVYRHRPEIGPTFRRLLERAVGAQEALEDPETGDDA